LQGLLAANQLRASRDGADVCEACRGGGATLQLAHSGVELPDEQFDEAVILHVSPARVKFWGARDGVSGVWTLSPYGLRLWVPLPAVDRLIPGPFGAIPVGPAGPGYEAYVFGKSRAEVPIGTQLMVRDTGAITTVLPGSPIRAAGQWWYLSEDTGGPVRLIPVNARRLLPFQVDGGMAYVVSDAEGDGFLLDGEHCRLGSERLVNIWPSRDGRAVATLLQDGPGGSLSPMWRRLIIGEETVYEGVFFMDKGDFAWSPNGEHFVAKLTMLDGRGVAGEQSLLTRTGRESFGADESVYEPMVDDRGRIAYIYDGERRLVVADGTASEPLLYAWNISFHDGAVRTNLLGRDGNIYRAEIRYSR
jgi:hypothetical protein